MSTDLVYNSYRFLQIFKLYVKLFSFFLNVCACKFNLWALSSFKIKLGSNERSKKPVLEKNSDNVKNNDLEINFNSLLSTRP